MKIVTSLKTVEIICIYFGRGASPKYEEVSPGAHDDDDDDDDDVLLDSILTRC